MAGSVWYRKVIIPNLKDKMHVMKSEDFTQEVNMGFHDIIILVSIFERHRRGYWAPIIISSSLAGIEGQCTGTKPSYPNK
jgi:hypothetical protein